MLTLEEVELEIGVNVNSVKGYLDDEGTLIGHCVATDVKDSD